MSSFFAGAVITTFRAPASMWPLARTASLKNPVELDDDVHTEVAPREPLRVPLGKNLDDPAVHRDTVSTGNNCPGETPEDAVVLEQVGQHLRGGDVVDGDDLEIGGTLSRGAQHVSPDAAEAVDTNSDSHAGQPPVVSMIDAGLAARSHPITGLTRGGDQTVKAAGHRRPAAARPFRQVRQVVIGVTGAQQRGLAQRGRQRLPARGVGLEQGDRTRPGGPRRPPSGAGSQSRR